MTDRRIDPSLLDGVGEVSEKWKFKFRFFAEHGIPTLVGSTPECHTAFRELTLNQRRILAFNFAAFFFSFIYLLVLGLWRKAISLCLVGLAITALAVQTSMPDSMELGLSVAVMLFVAARTNMYYYDLMVRVEQTWWL